MVRSRYVSTEVDRVMAVQPFDRIRTGQQGTPVEHSVSTGVETKGALP